MKINEILEIETENTGAIYLIKEDMFWRAYQKSAYLFFENVYKYQITNKYFKNVNSNVVFLGFPESSLTKILAMVGNKTIDKKVELIKVTSFDCDLQLYENWTNNLQVLETTKVVKLPKEEGGFQEINSDKNEKINEKTEVLLKQLMNFSVATNSPLECQQFIVHLQSLFLQISD